MVTKTEAITGGDFHVGTCIRHTGPRGGVTEHIIRVRSNGACKTWKTRPNDFRLPVKHGLYSYGYIDQDTACMYHRAEDCPLNTETR